jgi:hypothetical protein
VIQEAPVFNLADPAAAVQTMQQRMQQISTVENWTGKRVSPLQPQEVEQLGKFVRQLPLDQAGTMLGAIGGPWATASAWRRWPSSCTTRTARWAWR